MNINAHNEGDFFAYPNDAFDASLFDGSPEAQADKEIWQRWVNQGAPGGAVAALAYGAGSFKRQRDAWAAVRQSQLDQRQALAQGMDGLNAWFQAREDARAEGLAASSRTLAESLSAIFGQPAQSAVGRVDAKGATSRPFGSFGSAGKRPFAIQPAAGT